MPIRSFLFLVPLAGAALLAGCAATPASGSAPSASPSATAEAVTVDNCGTSVTFDAAPQRVVTIKSTSTEMLLALGLGDRIVATAFQDGPLPDDLAKAGASLTSIADQVPSEETVLGLEPDLVYAGWESNLTAEGAGARDELASLGIASYVSPAACKEPEYQPKKLSWDDVYAEITEVGDIFRVPDAAAALVRDQQAEVKAITPDDRGLTALWYSSGSATPYVGAGIGNPELLLDTIGLTNIAGDVQDTWTPYSWESVVAADPDVIVLVDASWNSAQKKMDQLAGDPVTANLTAVKNKSYLVVPFAASEAGSAAPTRRSISPTSSPPSPRRLTPAPRQDHGDSDHDRPGSHSHGGPRRESP
ncbi:putative F420-0 ABC transporter substrate-binding protein [Naasia aerilata]